VLRLAVKHLIGKKLHILHYIPAKKIVPGVPAFCLINRADWLIKFNKFQKNTHLSILIIDLLPREAQPSANASNPISVQTLQPLRRLPLKIAGFAQITAFN
jgi:hypothetical protein